MDAMVRLSEAFRAHLATLSPTFWRKADDSAQKQAAFLRILLPLRETLAFVAADEHQVIGFAIARITPAPPVYAPGGPVCLIDDFCVADDGSWRTVGGALVDAIESTAREQDAVLTVVVCPSAGGAKRDFLAARGFTPTSEWHVRELPRTP